MAEVATLPLSQLGLPLTDLADFVMDVGANWSNLDDSNHKVRTMGYWGFVFLGVSGLVNACMLFNHLTSFKRLYSALTAKSTVMQVAYFIWMPLAITNIEVVVLYIVFVKLYAGRVDLKLGSYQILNVGEDAEFLPKALRNDLEIAVVHVKKFALFSQVFENVPEMWFQGRACLIMMEDDPPRIPGDWQLLSLATTFAMLFGKMTFNMFLFSIDVSVTKQLLQRFVTQGLPKPSKDPEDGTAGYRPLKKAEDTMNDGWRLPAIKWAEVGFGPYFLSFLASAVMWCTVAYFGQVFWTCGLSKEELLLLVIPICGTLGVLSLIFFFIMTRLIVQELDLCWQLNLDLYTSTLVLMCSSFSPGLLGVIHRKLVRVAAWHLAGWLPALRSALLITLLVDANHFPENIVEVMGHPRKAWDIHGWVHTIQTARKHGLLSVFQSLALQRLLLLVTNLFMLVLHVVLLIRGSCSQRQDSYSSLELGSNDYITVQQLMDVREHLEEIQAQHIAALLSKPICTDEEVEDLLEEALIIFDTSHEEYIKLVDFKERRRKARESLQNAKDVKGSSSLRKYLEEMDKVGLDLTDYQQEVAAREEAESVLSKAIETIIGSEGLDKAIENAQGAYIDLEPAKQEVETRANAEKALKEAMLLVGSEPLNDALKQHEGVRVDTQDVIRERFTRCDSEEKVQAMISRAEILEAKGIKGHLREADHMVLDLEALLKKMRTGKINLSNLEACLQRVEAKTRLEQEEERKRKEAERKRKQEEEERRRRQQEEERRREERRRKEEEERKSRNEKEAKERTSRTENKSFRKVRTVPHGTRLATADEVRQNKAAVCRLMGEWDRCELAAGWVIDGRGYGNKIFHAGTAETSKMGDRIVI